MSDPQLPDFEIRADPARVTTASRWNTGLVVAAAALLVLAVAGLVAVAVTGFGSWFTSALLVVLALLCVGVLVTARSRTRMLRLLSDSRGGDGVLRAGHDGIRLPGLGEIAWTELVFVCVTNDRTRVARGTRVPVFGWAGRAAIRAGNGTILCELAVRDGEALRRRARDAAAASRVTLYPRWADGKRRGTVPLLLDAVYDELDTQAVVTMLFAQAERRGIAHALFEQLPAALRWKGPYLDEVIAGALPR